MCRYTNMLQMIKYWQKGGSRGYGEEESWVQIIEKKVQKNSQSPNCLRSFLLMCLTDSDRDISSSIRNNWEVWDMMYPYDVWLVD